MDNASMLERSARALSECLLEELARCEDLDSVEAWLCERLREVGARALGLAIEGFDRRLRACPPLGWSPRQRRSRTLVTLVGRVTFARTSFSDPFGRTRRLADELLGVPARRRLSSGAFLWLARRASEQSCRKAARDFAEMSGASVSHVAVMACVREGVAAMLSEGAESAFTLDAFHVQRAIARALPDPDDRLMASAMARAGCVGPAVEPCRSRAQAMEEGPARDRIEQLAGYLAANEGSISNNEGHALGSMEGTIAHVWAPRLKGQGRSWSREGAEAMCVLRAAIAQGRPLLAPPKGAWLTREQRERELEARAATAASVAASDGQGWEPPHRFSTTGRPASVRHGARSGALAMV